MEIQGARFGCIQQHQNSFLDAKVAAKLCIGGPCKYVVKENSGITNDWLLHNLVPNIHNRVSDGIAVILAKSLLWFALCGIQNETDIPQGMTNCIRTSYAALQNDLEEGENPMQKIFLVVTGHEGVTYIDKLVGTMTPVGKEEI